MWLNIGLLEASHVAAWHMNGGGELYSTAEWRQTLFGRIVQMDGNDDPTLWWGWGLYHHFRGDREAALAAWQRAGIEPATVAKTQGYYASALDHPTIALEWFSLAVELNPKLGNIWHELGMLYEDGGNLEAAREAYAEAVELGYADSVDSLAELWRLDKNHEEAVRIWQAALTTYPTHEDRLRWWRGLSNSLRAMAAWSEALVATKVAVKEFPDDAQLHVERGYAIYYGSNDPASAIREFQRASKLDENMATAYAAMGEISVAEANYSSAIDYFSLAIERDSSNRTWHLERASAALQEGDLNKSLYYFEEVVELWPAIPYPYYRQALVLQLLGRPQDAIASVEKAINLAPSPEPQYYLRAAALYEEIGNQASAIGAYRAVLRIRPDNEAAREGIERLQATAND